MATELTQEQIVTNLLTSNQILKTLDKSFNNPDKNYNLGDFLSNIPKEDIENTPVKNSKYTFIQDNLWKY